MAHFKKLSELLHNQLTQPGIQLYFLRHGQSLANHAGSIVGWTDSKLSVKGRQQSNQLFRAFYPHAQKFSKIHSSDLTRCRDTLNLALGFPNIQFHLSKDLRQLNFGDMEGVHFDSLPPEDKAKVNNLNYEAPNGQNWKQARQRAMRYIGQLGEGHHLICTHGGLMCALSYELGLKHVVANCSVVGVQLCPERKELIKLNFSWQFNAQPAAQAE